MANREEMLARIGRALGREKFKGSVSIGTDSSLPPPKLNGVMPAIASEDLLCAFEAELAKVAGVAHRASTAQELDEILRKIVEASKGDSVVLSRNPLLIQLKPGNRLRALGVTVVEWPAAGEPAVEVREAFREACFAAAIGITGVDWALAETGSLVVTSESEGSQLASLAPPIHIALYTREQLVGSLDDVLERMPLGRNPQGVASGRSVVFITGVSRTADIEQILIRGVHGPRELHAVLIESSLLDPSASK